MYKVIDIKDIEGISIGQEENREAGTGCTVILADTEMAAGLDVRGGGPASRESELLNPLASAQTIHAIVLAGGSAYGLGAADGVMKYLEERGRGLRVDNMVIPLVCQSDIFDLTCGDHRVRPDIEMGYQACVNSEKNNYRDGNYGAGCGATVGKVLGMGRCMKSGIGSYAIDCEEFKIGAIAVVNAFGDVYDETGKMIAGVLTEDKQGLDNTVRIMNVLNETNSGFAGNTTLGVIITDARFDKSRLCKIAGMGHNGYARSIRPVHTSMDGDSIYAVSVGDNAANSDFAGTLGALVMTRAIEKAVKSAEASYGYPAHKDIVKNQC